MHNKHERSKALALVTLEDTPLGAMTLAASQDGLAYLNFLGQRDFLSLLGGTPLVQDGRALQIVQQAARQVGEYFAHQRRTFDLPLELAGLTDFTRLALEETMRIPYGQTLTYGQVADQIGKPRAARAVGGALARNPLTLVIPCHRVLAADGSLHGYSSPGGVATKARLLEWEGCRLHDGRLA